jgi:hypothetical protein
MRDTIEEALKLALEALENGKRVRNAEGGTKYQPDLEDKAITAIKQALAAPVQEPFCFVYVENGEEYFAPKGAYVPDNAQPLYTNPPAQPAVPDEITDRSESPEYIQGWNDCRALMLEMARKL